VHAARGLACLTLILVTRVAVGATPVIHVRGAARVSASASSLEGSVIVTGSVSDDTGRPVGGALLTARALAADTSPVPLPTPSACPNQPSLGGAPGNTRPEQTLRADGNGRFCALFVTDRASQILLAFNDARGLIDASEQRIVVDHARRGVELRLAPTAATFELERESHRLQVSARVAAPLPGASTPLPLAVYAATPNGEVLVAQGACPADGAAELDVASSRLAGPGPIELILRFAGSAALQPAEARRRVLATARVRLELGRTPAPADPTEGIPLDVALASAAGAVDGGSVEARLGDQTVGLAKVERGAARLIAQFPRRGDSAKLELRYLAAEPWWRPGDSLALDVKLLSRARWVSLGWMSALAAIAIWLLWGFRRPARPGSLQGAVGPRAPVAGVHLVKREDGHFGWRGVVRDAHEEVPIPGASVALVSPGPDRSVHARVVADEQGAFELAAGAPGELELAVSAPWHSDFTCRAPPHGELRIDLVSRRRQLLGRLVRWASQRAPHARDRAEPTPGDVKRYGRRASRDEVVEWAGAVEHAAFGPEAVNETIERDVIRREPPDRVEPSPRDVKRDH
jgi:hypothetical protein